ncbi:gasdermin-C-like [Sorex araneus]|uniref:gasdermin-C-like n=1 Tax=Sorex araneus TaxID=42254 RepID=UPI0024335DF6|nr:gasdermin-C-like [Sorex araneus]
MVVIFDEAVKSLLRQVGKEDLKPVTNLESAKKFRHFNMLRNKKNSLSSFWKQPDIPAEFSLLDILDPSSPVPDPSREGPFIYKDNMVWKGKGDMTIDAGFGAQVTASGETNESRESFLKFQINEITTKTWTELRSRVLLKPEPWFLEQCRKRGDNLYVVTETVELTNSPELSIESGRKWLGKLSIPQNPYIKGQGHVDGDKKKQQLLTLPEHTVMAYQTKQLIIKEDGWVVSSVKFACGHMYQEMWNWNDSAAWSLNWAVYYAGRKILLIKDKKKKTFSEDHSGHFLSAAFKEEILPKGVYLMGGILSYTYLLSRFSDKQLNPHFIDMENFKKLQDEISRRMEQLYNFSKDIQDILFHNILVMLGDRGALQDLQDMVRQFPPGDLDGPGGIILNELRKNFKNFWTYQRSCIPYMLEALMVLNDTQHKLLAWSMEKKILVHQRELVRSILEPNFKYTSRIPFTLKPELLTPLQDEGVTVTYRLLEECGLMIDLNCNRSFWDLEAKMSLSALYGCLSLLQQLAVA